MQIVVGITFQNPGKYLQNFGVTFELKGLIVRTKKKEKGDSLKRCETINLRIYVSK